jgi:hypothetical protein
LRSPNVACGCFERLHHPFSPWQIALQESLTDLFGRAAHAVADALFGSGTDLDRYGRWSTGLVEEFTRQRRQQYAIEGLTRKDGFWPRRLARALEGGPNEGLHQRIDD